jgi:hypothetical protein
MAVILAALRAANASVIRKIPGTYFCYRISKPQGHSTVGRIRKIEEKSCGLIRIRIRDLLGTPASLYYNMRLHLTLNAQWLQV